ncbi:hypothetical protein [Legionella sainthelensi]|uniref:hypothetical protein n=1 Tax=Legionella sainthelensi TaxID=28087 RepID=UPI000E1FE843|nr:hypothetical protein [Legionella sainthelensi]
MGKNVPLTEMQNFESFFNEILSYAEQGGDEELLQSLFEKLEKQIQGWLATPSSHYQYARLVMKSIIEANIADAPLPVKAQVSYLRGIIHDQGFHDIKKHPRQAMVDYKDAVSFGSVKAWDKIGDHFFAQATSSNLIVSSHPSFFEAIRAYQKAGSISQEKVLYSGLMTLYKDEIAKGDFDKAIKVIAEINHFVHQNQNMDIPQKIREISVNIDKLRLLQTALEDAQKISATYLKSIQMSPEQMQEAFLLCKKTNDTPNPIFDYYHAQILATSARLMKHQTPEKKQVAEGMQKESKKLFEKILHGEYDLTLKPLQLFAQGIYYEDNQIENAKVPPQKYFQKAAKSGCYLAYYHLANIAHLSEDEKNNVEHYYKLGSNAGDPACQLAYYRRCLLPELQKAITEKDTRQICAIADKSYDLLQLIQNNPHTLNSALPFLETHLKDLKGTLSKYGENLEILTSKYWESVPITEINPDFLNAIQRYETISSDDLHNRLKILQEIKQTCNHIFMNKEQYKPKVLEEVDKLYTQLADVIYITSKKNYQIQLQNIATRTPKERLIDIFHFMKQPGHMDNKYFIELSDPIHRKPELFSTWMDTPGAPSYFKWLASFDSFDHQNVQQIIYLDEEQRQKFEATIINGQVYNKKTDSLIHDGHYLLAITPSKQIYIASEDQESSRSMLFHHSSFNAGNHLMFAGEVDLQGGKIVKINNYSGHYLPEITALYRAVLLFKSNNAFDQNLRIGYLGNAIPDNFSMNQNELRLDEFRLLAITSMMKQPHTSANDNIKPEPMQTNSNSNTIQKPVTQDFFKQIEKSIVNYLIAESRIAERIDTILSNNYQHTFFGHKTIQMNQKNIVLPKNLATEYQQLHQIMSDGNWLNYPPFTAEDIKKSEGDLTPKKVATSGKIDFKNRLHSFINGEKENVSESPSDNPSTS